MKVKQWPLVVIIVLLSVVIGIMVYDRLRPRVDTVNAAKYQELQHEKDSLKLVIDNFKPDTVIVPEGEDSLIISKLNKTLYEINKMRSDKPVIGDSDLRQFFSELYLYTQRQP